MLYIIKLRFLIFPPFFYIGSFIYLTVHRGNPTKIFACQSDMSGDNGMGLLACGPLLLYKGNGELQIYKCCSVNVGLGPTRSCYHCYFYNDKPSYRCPLQLYYGNLLYICNRK